MPRLMIRPAISPADALPAAQPQPEGVVGGPVLEPAHDIVFPESDQVGGVMLHPEGQRAFVQLRADAVDLWDLVVYAWPETLGALAAIAALLGAWRIARIFRRRQQPGAPRCRRCNYNLSGHADRLAGAAAGAAPAESAAPEPVRCPECGIDLSERAPVTGRATLRRAAPAFILMILVIGAYLALHAAGATRSSAAGWVHAPSLRAERMRRDHGLTWMDDFQTTVDVILELDLDSGATLRRVAVRPTSTYFPPDLSPDGSLMTLDGSQDRIDLVSTDSGRTVASFRNGGDVGGLHRTVRFAPAGNELYAAIIEQDRDRLVRWNWKTGARDTIVDSEAYQWAVFGDLQPVVRHYAMLHRPAGLRILAAPSFMEAYPDIGHYMRLYDEAGAELGHYPIDGPSPTAAPVVTPDGGRAFIAGRMQGVHGFDLEEGRSLAWLDPGAPPGDELAIDPAGRLLAIPIHGGRIRLRDIDRGRWAGELRFDAKLIGLSPRFSPDGRWLAAVCFESSRGGAAGGGAGAYIHHLIVFDLAEIRDGLDGDGVLEGGSR